MLAEFKEFINRGNVMDLAVAVIIGAAFGAIVTSLVDDIIMPIVGILLGGIDFTSLALSIGNASIMYGSFIQTIVNFLIIAFAIFIMVRALNRMQARFQNPQEEEKAAAPSEPSTEERILGEIRDLLRANASVGAD